ncbi:bifunctional 3-deoxy-7-phosphoheptulonate synthase/chorismate mutase [Pelosinus propionicus]|uniref:3-deoxy-D-arabinoheptulosonate-7-phosphate synthase /chorismate mutase n=1 Tax=Pelosinus propionicus DSM 13327 TaxID=1123291 RepID=A0A1I4JM70_9FIRM|nr:bifunctional 3-deoxy-7-phosphoheptulonate synthase/chorismate mutase [Pelosinus propionicus]SFL67705.1 3-deoxy-D-arabinoheptulosonate-7-phosphate synthase /chorismate mutase [Pelosinus propionicus DSM 13327]
MSNNELRQLQKRVNDVNLELLKLINERGKLIQDIEQAKGSQGIHHNDPARVRKMLDTIHEHNHGPFEKSTIEHIFKEIFKAGLELNKNDHRKALLVSRKCKAENTIINIRGKQIGDNKQHFIFGPCAVESYEQVAAVASAMKEKGLKLLRGGAYKPRTSPYDFQGLGIEGLKILKRIADEYDMAVISEIVNAADLNMAVNYIDVIQIGSRNMQNFELLKAAGGIHKPILLKRGLAATIEEFINAAEYIMSQGNDQIILCERGIRTYETATRNTLDISAVPLLKQETHLPVFVDVTHSTGRKDLLLPAAKAAMAIGADGVMAEVHPDPAVALSDSAQQMDLKQFDHFFNELVNSNFVRI